MPVTRLNPSRNDLPDTIRQAMTSLLNVSLVTAIDLYTQVKQAHWMVKGPQFIALHELFDEMATELADQGDTLAERITALAGLPTGTARQVAAQSPLPELPAETQEGMTLVRLLAERYALYAQQVREASDTAAEQGDASTADLFTGLSRDADKRLWFLEAHLQ
jgi:starvation-inducible DNA-binding protein